jgi:HD-like signal output (HDOD) protein
MKTVEDRSAPYVPAFTLTPDKRAPDPSQAVGDVVQRPNFINDIAAGRVELPTIPRVVQRLIAALGDPDVDTRKIGEALSQDPVLSAKVLRLANSAFFGGQRSMSSIDAAIAMIGIQALNRLIVACGVSSSFKDIPGIDLPTFWRDALVAATAANKLAPRLEADAEEAYTCGLLHATGHLILCQTYPEIADVMFTGFAVVRGAELAAVEINAFGIDHPAVGALWVESLGFPQAVADTIRSAAQPLADADAPLLLVLRSACVLATAVAQKDGAEAALAALPPRVRGRFSGADGAPDAAFAKLYDALQETEPTF